MAENKKLKARIVVIVVAILFAILVAIPLAIVLLSVFASNPWTYCGSSSQVCHFIIKYLNLQESIIYHFLGYFTSSGRQRFTLNYLP
jgi:hypothetical protein